MVNPEGRRYVDLSIRVERDLVSGVEAHLASGPEHRILGKEDVPFIPPPVTEMLWQEELLGLGALIEQTETAYSEANPTSIEGFKQLLLDCKNSLKIRGRTFDSLDGFKEAIMQELSKNHDDYSDFDKKPVGRGGHSNTYTRLSNHSITPRQIRLLIMGMSLSGEVITPEGLSIMEGINYIRVKPAIKDAQYDLCRALTPNYTGPFLRLRG